MVGKLYNIHSIFLLKIRKIQGVNMMKKIDLSGQIFGRLTVLEQAENIITPNGRSHVAWRCLCECGNIVNVRSEYLRNGHTVSCGCRAKETLKAAGKKRISNLVGKQFGRLTVIKDSGKRETSGGVLWECQCSCGNIVYVSTSNLTRPNGSTISCGCVKSKGEEKIIASLLEAQITFITQKRFDTCVFPETNRQLVFDFYLPEQNILIEYDGEQHFHKVRNDRYDYQNIVKRDNYKNQWCKDNNIPLIRIPYTEYKNINANYMRRIIERNGWTEIK